MAAAGLCQAMRLLLLPRATLLTPNRREASRLLGLSEEAGTADPATVPQLAQALRELGAAAVVITGGDTAGPASADWLEGPHTSGWLALPRVNTPHHHGTGCTFASSAAAALALGFVPADAVVLAKMATTEGLRHAHAAGAGAGPLKPQPGFARRLANLPTLSLAGALHAADPLQPAPPRLQGEQRHLGLYPVVDSADWVARVLAAGVRTVQLRIKNPQQPDLREQVRRSVQAARAVGAQLYINDHWRLAIEEGAFGVHLGQEDLETADVRAIARAGLHLGLSTHSLWEVCRAWALQPAYIACGPIHATASKDMPWLPQGNANLAFWSQLLPVPVVAIAGMDAPRLREAARHGAAGGALISAVTAAPDPEAALAELAAAWAAGRSDAPAPAPLLPRSTLAPA
jgi:hydroxymethylpyrimidine kinase/phosphomethylpyrimidine kinase/thiamine-phosphate diphosphorylase